ncbi:MAG TPA: bifunctional ADP-heptose synthase [Fimbriimonadaceae bacterium]|nr:bifunctional ADP-heptose synthase [Fimbriimonadaceae bacterium]
MSLASLLGSFCERPVLVVGDLMLDEYILGRATRISPEAPVMVIRQQSTMSMPGGAANVAKNIIALGGSATILGIVGNDPAADTLKRALAEQHIDHASLVHDPARPTTRKTRVLADHAHQVLRIDHEEETPLSEAAEADLLRQALALVDAHEAVILSDYLKGALTPNVSARIIERAQQRGIPTVVNPKPRSVGQYVGATVLSLNRAEAGQALERWHGLSDDDAPAAAAALKDRLGVGNMLITLGESGLVASGAETYRVPAPRVEVYDTAGAGDTIVATVALGAAAKGDFRQTLELATKAAAAVVRKVGVATPTHEDLEEIGREP